MRIRDSKSSEPLTFSSESVANTNLIRRHYSCFSSNQPIRLRGKAAVSASSYPA